MARRPFRRSSGSYCRRPPRQPTNQTPDGNTSLFPASDSSNSGDTDSTPAPVAFAGTGQRITRCPLNPPSLSAQTGAATGRAKQGSVPCWSAIWIRASQGFPGLAAPEKRPQNIPTDCNDCTVTRGLRKGHPDADVLPVFKIRRTYAPVFPLTVLIEEDIQAITNPYG